MAKIRRSDEELPLSPPVFYVLLAVADQERHGYAIMQEVEKRTEGKVQLLLGSLYSTLKRMVAACLIEECDGAGQSDDERRRYYRITNHGKEVAAAEVDRMATLIAVARSKRLTTALGNRVGAPDPGSAGSGRGPVNR
ncbi:MAG: PadR family transcriptional regulator [Gemmatimonadales bacterium]